MDHCPRRKKEKKGRAPLAGPFKPRPIFQYGRRLLLETDNKRLLERFAAWRRTSRREARSHGAREVRDERVQPVEIGPAISRPSLNLAA